MRILVEKCSYPADKVRDILQGIESIADSDGKILVNYVGYFYNTQLNDLVFILPKVVLDKEDKVFGKYTPESIMNIDLESGEVKKEGDNNEDIRLTSKETAFIYNLSIWIYRAIQVFEKKHKGLKDEDDTTIVYRQSGIKLSHSKNQLSNTFFDIILSLIRFFNENQDFFFFTLRNLHSGFNKINWSKTISGSQAIIQGKDVVYVNPVNKKRVIDFDEELLIIFFSILDYISYTYGFKLRKIANFELIPKPKFKLYLDHMKNDQLVKGLGCPKLLNIKYKYYSDKALKLWQLCYDFFDATRQVMANPSQKDYLLAHTFHVVFEKMVDDLISERDIPKELHGENLKREIDHLYLYEDLITNSPKNQIYNIGDSKYYKLKQEIDEYSVSKQFEYAANAINYNIKLWNNSATGNTKYKVRLYDDFLRSYNFIPNFFISGIIPDFDNFNSAYADDKVRPADDRKNQMYSFAREPNRFFDGNTFIVYHYDISFLFLLSLYARNNGSEENRWKEKVYELFRNNIQIELIERYDFYLLKSKNKVQAESYINSHFRDLDGRIYRPFFELGNDWDKYFVLALLKEDRCTAENTRILNELKSAFYCVKYDNDETKSLGSDPVQMIAEVENAPITIADLPDSNVHVLLPLNNVDLTVDHIDIDLNTLSQLNLSAIRHFISISNGRIIGICDVSGITPVDGNLRFSLINHHALDFNAGEITPLQPCSFNMIKGYNQ